MLWSYLFVARGPNRYSPDWLVYLKLTRPCDDLSWVVERDARVAKLVTPPN
jgi:hypothetical protein